MAPKLPSKLPSSSTPQHTDGNCMTSSPSKPTCSHTILASTDQTCPKTDPETSSSRESSPVKVQVERDALSRELGGFYETQEELNLAWKRQHELEQWQPGPNAPALWILSEVLKRRYMGTEATEETERMARLDLQRQSSSGHEEHRGHAGKRTTGPSDAELEVAGRMATASSNPAKNS